MSSVMLVLRSSKALSSVLYVLYFIYIILEMKLTLLGSWIRHITLSVSNAYAVAHLLQVARYIMIYILKEKFFLLTCITVL